MANETPESIETEHSPLAYQSTNPYRIKQAVENANLMLAHASEKGLKIDAELVAKIVKAKYIQSNGEWNATNEAEFWQAFRDISQTIHPVTIDSILAANQELEERNWWSRMMGIRRGKTLTRRAVSGYVRWSLLALAAMLIIQIYSLIGTTILNNIRDSNARINKMEDEIILQQKLESTQKAIAIELNKDMVVAEREKNIELLAIWLRPIDFVLLNEPADLSVLEKTKSEKNKEDFEKINALGTSVTQSAQHPILIIGSYILPLFYGLLGAFAYVLRGLSEEIREITYSVDSDIKYILRITLGALAGLAVGLVFVPDTDHFVTLNLPPLTLAFIAGYSIEFLFTAIDRFVLGVNKTKAKS